jgi:peptidoglycan/LPS O-acetylase OafA/YrhL
MSGDTMSDDALLITASAPTVAAQKYTLRHFLAGLAGRPMSLQDGLECERRDNYLLLRHIAAALLIYSHSYALAPAAKGQSDIIAALLPGFYGGKVAVLLFFAISGFLVTSSYLRHPNLLRFVAARVLRIYPAYVICLIVALVATGLFFTRVPAHEFFSMRETWRYLLHNLGLTGLQYTLPGAYDASGYAGVVNGSLWSLALEVRLYLYLAVLALCQLFRWRLLAAALLGAAVVGVLMMWPSLPLDSEGKRALTCVFASTAAAACAARYVPVSTRLLLLLAALTWLLRDSALFYALTLACLTYFTFWFAYRVPAVPLRLPGDYSYGLFLYGFPVQQALVQIDADIGALPLTAGALFIALLLAVLSWHLIERRALDFKRTRSKTIADLKAEEHGIEQGIEQNGKV